MQRAWIQRKLGNIVYIYQSGTIRAFALVLLVPLLLAVGGCKANAQIPQPPPRDWSITLTWHYDFSNFVPCSSTVTVGCVTGFTWGYTPASGSAVTLKTSPVSVCSGSTQPETCTDTTNSTLGIGSVNWFCVTNGIDNSGNKVTSSPANATSTVQLVTPSGVVATLK